MEGAMLAKERSERRGNPSKRNNVRSNEGERNLTLDVFRNLRLLRFHITGRKSEVRFRLSTRELVVLCWACDGLMSCI